MLGSDNSSQPKIATINYNVMICMFIYTVSRFFDEIDVWTSHVDFYMDKRKKDKDIVACWWQYYYINHR